MRAEGAIGDDFSRIRHCRNKRRKGKEKQTRKRRRRPAAVIALKVKISRDKARGRGQILAGEEIIQSPKHPGILFLGVSTLEVPCENTMGRRCEAFDHS